MDQRVPNSVEESQRLENVKYLNILDSATEDRFERITQSIAAIFKVPYVTIGIVDINRVWYKSRLGLSYKQIPRVGSFEDYVVRIKNHVFTNNAHHDSRFSNSYLVQNEPHVEFCVSLPLFVSKNFVVGAISIMSPQKLNISELSMQVLKNLSQWAQSEVISIKTPIESVHEQISLTREQLSLRSVELEHAKARQAAMLENIGDGVIGINDSGQIVFINHSASQMLGWANNELLGKMFMHTVQMFDENNALVEIPNRPIRNALFHQQRVSERNHYYIKKDGSKLAVSVTASPVVINTVTIGGVIVFRDITKEKEVDRMKTEFISLASHQLRTPLSAMKWFAELLLDGDVGELTPDQKEMISNINASNERMIELVNSLLNISRIESGRIIIDPQPTNLHDLLDEVIKEVEQKLTEKKLKLAISIHKELPLINIDPKLIRHVYMNLLTNAIKYTPENGQIVVMISKKEEQIISQISDNGYGIPAAQQEKVFQKFFRADNIVKVETDGTGLGLYLIKAIVESSGGKIWFKSKEGQGTTFWFSLPLIGTKPKKGEVVISS